MIISTEHVACMELILNSYTIWFGKYGELFTYTSKDITKIEMEKIDGVFEVNSTKSMVQIRDLVIDSC
jgi:hypothetical protein